MIKKFFMAFLLCATVLAVSAAAVGEERVEFYDYIDATELPTVSLFSNEEWEDGWTSYGDQLTGDAREIYEAFETALANDALQLKTVYYNNGSMAQCWMMTMDYSVPYTNFNAELSKWFNNIYDDGVLACRAFSYDHPEYFWIRQAYSVGYSASGNGSIATITLSVGYIAQPSCDTVEERDVLKEKLTSVIEDILSAVEGKTTVEKLEYFDSWLASNNHYNHTAADTDDYIKTDDTPWSIVGALLDEEGKYSPVCEGYSKAFQLLCHKIGVPCLEISGYAFFGDHMWTAVQLEGKWYVCDPTWDDPVYAGSGDGAASTKAYFLIAQPSSHRVNMPTLVTPEISDCDYSERWGNVALDDNEVAKVAGVEQTIEGLRAGILFDESMMEKTVTALVAVYQDGKMVQMRQVDVTVHENGIQTVDLGESVPEGCTFCLMVTMIDWVPVCDAFRVTEF